MRNSTMEKLAGLWCKLMHDEPMWPVNGKYICRTCLRAHPVEWSNSTRVTVIAGSPALGRLAPVKAES